MRLSVFGLGYVGTVSAASFAARGHHVTGVDMNAGKAERIRSGQAPIVEDGLSALIEEAVSQGRLTATTDAGDAVAGSDVSFVCVGTPSARNGSLDTGALRRVLREIGTEIGKTSSHHTVVVRSTMLPGTYRNLVLPELESASGKCAGTDFAVAINPEFLREGSAVADFHNPEKTVVGSDDGKTAQAVMALYDGLPGHRIEVSPEIAEIAKYVDNVWHALKVSFANEVGNICKALEIDSHAVMDVFRSDRKLNISSAYLNPGFAFGGSCLPKDTRAIAHLSRQCDLELPLLQSIIASNQQQIERAVEWVLSFGKRRIAVLGCAFKAGTDDLRESPFIILAERLMGKGCALRIFDNNVRLSMLTGANRDYVHATIPHIASLLVGSAEEALEEADIVILTANVPEYVGPAGNLSDGQLLLDFAHVPALRDRANYHGVNW
ncbi:MAG: nucleotide sugar dehydrogenase [Rhizomicrobium sp.]|jgi:GDP-mannose 6-dehydrogenase